MPQLLDSWGKGLQQAALSSQPNMTNIFASACNLTQIILLYMVFHTAFFLLVCKKGLKSKTIPTPN
jgi:hypothetical protein